MVLSSLIVSLGILGQQHVGIPDHVIAIARSRVMSIREAWRQDRPDLNPSVFESAIRLLSQNDLTFSLHASVDGSSTFWRDGTIQRYDVAVPGLPTSRNSSDMSRSEIEARALRFAVAAGHPAQARVFETPAPGILYLRPTWHGIPFSRSHFWVGMNPKNGHLKYIRSLYRAGFAKYPESWVPSQSIGAQSATAQAASILAQHGAFTEAEIVSSELQYYYRDPDRLQKVAPQVHNLATPSVPIESVFVLGMVPGLSYNPPTSVCYQVQIKTPLQPERQLGDYSTWWLYIDAMSGEPINVEYMPELKFIGAKAEKTATPIQPALSSSAKLAWKGKLLPLKMFSDPPKQSGNEATCAIIDGKRAYCGRVDERRGVVKVRGRAYMVKLPEDSTPVKPH